MRRSFALFLIGSLVLITVAGCEKIEEDPTPTPNQQSADIAQTLFAPTPAPSSSPAMTPGAPAPSSDLEVELHRVIAHMEQAMLAGDVDGYMAYVSQADPVFWADHEAWARDWQEHRLKSVDLTIFNIKAASPTEATARLTLLWSQAGQTGAGSAGGATVSVRFRREDDGWRLAGEDWRSFDVEKIRFYYFADDIVNNQLQADTVRSYLADVYFAVTREFGYTPEQIAHFKMYETAATLQTMTRLSIPVLSLWNEPGESIKLTLGPENTAPRESFIAGEYTRFVLYEMSGDMPDRFPWWVEEGAVEYGRGLFLTLSQRNRILKRVAGLAFATENDDQQLLDWATLAGGKSSGDPTRHQLARDQAFTMMRYITETYGRDARNAWLMAMAGGATLDEATQTHLGVNFADLDAGWRAWLPEQL